MVIFAFDDDASFSGAGGDADFFSLDSISGEGDRGEIEICFVLSI
jgi:hypothetical protein